MEEAISKLNIGHFRNLLQQPGLGNDRRKELQALLTREEFNLNRLRRRTTTTTKPGIIDQ
jgi:hypothetical protein